MGRLLYSSNITVDGCCDHRAGMPDAATHEHAAQLVARADALILGRVTYQMMEEAWRPVAESGVRPEWMRAWMEPFAHTIHAVRKYVVSNTLDHVDWNAELVPGDLQTAVRNIKRNTPGELQTGGVTLPFALAELGLIDDYEFMVHPRIAGYGPTLLSGLSKHIDLRLVGHEELAGGQMVLRYETTPAAP